MEILGRLGPGIHELICAPAKVTIPSKAAS